MFLRGQTPPLFEKPHVATGCEIFDGYSTTLSPPIVSDPRKPPYSSARSRSSMTCTPRTVRIRDRMASTPVGSGRHSAVSPRWQFNVANVELLPRPMLPVPNCPIIPPPSLEIGIGHWQHFHIGNIRPRPFAHIIRRMIADSETNSQKKVVKVRTAIPVNGDKTTAKSFRELHIRHRVQFPYIIICEN